MKLRRLFSWPIRFAEAMWKGRGFGSVTRFPRSQILSATHESLGSRPSLPFQVGLTPHGCFLL